MFEKNILLSPQLWVVAATATVRHAPALLKAILQRRSKNNSPAIPFLSTSQPSASSCTEFRTDGHFEEDEQFMEEANNVYGEVRNENGGGTTKVDQNVWALSIKIEDSVPELRHLPSEQDLRGIRGPKSRSTVAQ